jgi:hypothetical protein
LPEWVDLIADTLNLSPRQLHVAAAKQHGFKLDLSKKQAGAEKLPLTTCDNLFRRWRGSGG